MTRILHPKTFWMSGVLVCPDCGATGWGSFRCRCGARVLGPRRKPHVWDPGDRVWLIDKTGGASLWDRFTNELIPFAETITRPAPIEEPDPPSPWAEVMI